MINWKFTPIIGFLLSNVWKNEFSEIDFAVSQVDNSN